MLSLSDLLRISARQAIRQRRHYYGVVMAIALGTAGFIVINALGRDVKADLNHNLEFLGRVTVIRASLEILSPGESEAARPPAFEPRTLAALRRAPGVLAVSEVVLAESVQATWENRYHEFRLLGVDSSFWEANGFTAAAGRLFTRAEVEGRKRVCVLGAETARKIFGSEDITGRYLLIGKDPYLAIGILGGVSAREDQSNYAFLPISTAQDRIPGITPPVAAYIRCLTWDDVARVAEAIPAIVGQCQPDQPVRLEVAWEHLKRVRRMAWWVEFFIHMSITATLVLGGFGIWNGMMVAVQARTREIGLKKAMGAEDLDILKQFLTEALCLSLGSSVLGVALGRAVMQFAKASLDSAPSENLFFLCAGLSLLLSVLLGVGAGFYPSLRASRMEVVTAIRYE